MRDRNSALPEVKGNPTISHFPAREHRVMSTATTVLLLTSCLSAVAQTHEKRIVPVGSSERDSFEHQTKVALLVGVGHYTSRSGLSTLQYPERDVDQLDAELTRQGYK